MLSKCGTSEQFSRCGLTTVMEEMVLKQSVQALLPGDSTMSSSNTSAPSLKSPKNEPEADECSTTDLKQTRHKLTKKQLKGIPEAEQYMYLKM